MPHRVPEDMPDRMLEGMPDRMPEGMPDRMPDRMSDRMPEDMPEDMPDKVPECWPDRMPADLPDNMPEAMLDRMPDGMPEDLPDNMPEDMPDRMPDGMPEDMPEHMPEDMPEHLPEDMPEHLPEDMPGRMPEGMPDRMPDRMPENMSDRMPEDLPVTKCINVMVGITRSKVIFIGDQPKQWYNPQAQVGGALAGQDHRPQGRFTLPGGNTGPIWVVIVSREVHHKGSMEARVRHLARQVAIKEIQVRQVVSREFRDKLYQVQAGPRARGEVPGKTLRSVELPKLDSHATALDFGNWLTVVQQMMGDVSYTSAQL